jgi:DNA topoisomerase VI subunit B
MFWAAGALAGADLHCTAAFDSDVPTHRPIQIKLPTQFDHYLVIQDFGLGLSIDDITEIYSRYGASTKRDTDDQTGMLGLGSKSALTYATQFTMTSVKNGVKAEVLISVKTNGAGVMEVMDTSTTTEPNGVRITIPTRPDNDFKAKGKPAEEFSREDKLALMKDVFSLEFGHADFASSQQVFPSFYC